MENAQVLKDSFCTIFAAEKKKDATKVVSQNQTHPSTSTRYSMCWSKRETKSHVLINITQRTATVLTLFSGAEPQASLTPGQCARG